MLGTGSEPTPAQRPARETLKNPQDTRDHRQNHEPSRPSLDQCPLCWERLEAFERFPSAADVLVARGRCTRCGLSFERRVPFGLGVKVTPIASGEVRP